MARSIRQQAERFLVWRSVRQAYLSVRGECTYADLARATGQPYSTVQQICVRNGWICRDQAGRQKIALDHLDLAAHRDLYEMFTSHGAIC